MSALTPRRFPAPWRVVEHAKSFWVQDASGQTVGWFYFRDHPHLKTAKALGLTVPQSILLRADEVIQ